MQTKHFLRMLDTELTCCIDDLQDLEQMLTERFGSMQITNYVYRENNALLKRETRGVQEIQRVVRAMKHDEFASIDEIVQTVQNAIQIAIAEHELPEAIRPLIMRRLKQVKEYVQTDSLTMA